MAPLGPGLAGTVNAGRAASFDSYSSWSSSSHGVPGAAFYDGYFSNLSSPGVPTITGGSMGTDFPGESILKTQDVGAVDIHLLSYLNQVAWSAGKTV